MSKGSVIDMVHAYFPSHLRSRREAQVMGSWMRGLQYEASETLDIDETDRAYGRAFSPDRRPKREYENLRALSPNSFAGLMVRSMSQLAMIEGISRPGVSGTLPIWDTFRRNRWISRQTAIHEAALGQSVAYGVVIPGEDPLTGTKMARMLGKSPERMSAYYDEIDDEWPGLAIEAVKTYDVDESTGVRFWSGWAVTAWVDYVGHRLSCKGNGENLSDWTYIDHFEHSIPVTPVARCANWMDLDGNATSIIEPVLPILRRLDQDTFDRLINQRFGAWQVRYIAGMAKPKAGSVEEEKIRLRVEDILVSENPETKFGTLPGGGIDPQIGATDHDLRLLSAISQLPPHHLLGLSSNLQAEALAAATEGMQRQSFNFRTGASEFHEQMARLASIVNGDPETAAAWDLRIRWRDNDSGSLNQAADALGKFATMLGVPVTMLWERIPGWTDDDVQRAKELVQDGAIEKLLQELLNSTPTTSTSDQGATGGSSNAQ